MLDFLFLFHIKCNILDFSTKFNHLVTLNLIVFEIDNIVCLLLVNVTSYLNSIKELKVFYLSFAPLSLSLMEVGVSPWLLVPHWYLMGLSSNSLRMGLNIPLWTYWFEVSPGLLDHHSFLMGFCRSHWGWAFESKSICTPNDWNNLWMWCRLVDFINPVVWVVKMGPDQPKPQIHNPKYANQKGKSFSWAKHQKGKSW